MIDLSPDLLLLAIPAVMLAGLVHGSLGIGFPIVATPILALFTDVFTAIAITLLPTIAVNTTVLIREYRLGLDNIRQHLLILPFVLIGTLIGSKLLIIIDPRPFLLLLALAIVLYLNQNHLKGLSWQWIHRRPLLAYMLFGLIAGLMAGTVNVMVPVLMILFMEMGLAVGTMIWMFNINFLTGKLTQSFYFHQQISGFENFLISSVWLIIPALLALWVGGKIRKKIKQDNFRKLFRILLAVMAVILTARFIYSYLP